MSTTDASSSRAAWSANGALAIGVALAVLLAAAGLLLSRADVALIALPLLIASAVAWDRRPRDVSSVNARIELTPTRDGSAIDYRCSLETPRQVEAVSLLVVTHGTESARLIVDAVTARGLAGRIRVVHSGPQEILRFDFSLVSPGGGFVTTPAAGPRSIRILPPALLPVASLPLQRRPHGLTGSHDTARPGDGGEFRDVARFVPGDRLRRIDWKATARRATVPGELYVRRSFGTADATVLMVVDSRDDVGEQVSEWGRRSKSATEATSLDLARAAAGSLATAYITAGDRVGFQDLSSSRKAIQPGGGMRQLQRLLPAIASASPSGQPVRHLRAPALPSGALVYVLSTFLDDEPLRMAIVWRAAGHRVIAVDVLPPLRTRSLSKEQLLAYRIVMRERGERVDELLTAGVETVTWSSRDPGQSPAAQLRRLSRPERTTR